MTKKKSEFKPKGGVELTLNFSDLKRLITELTSLRNGEYELNIRRINNGYRLRGTDNFYEVIEDRDDDPLYSHERLSRRMMEFFNFLGSKYDQERLKVVREKRED